MRPSACYVRLHKDTYQSTTLTTGPWSVAFSHGGPVVGLMAQHVSDRAAALGFGHVARLTSNIVRPVPVEAQLSVEVSDVYVGKSCAHLSGRLRSGDKDLVLCTALVVKEQETDLPASVASPPLPPPFSLAVPTTFGYKFAPVGYDDLVELRTSEGVLWRGPCCVWFRIRYPLIECDSVMASIARVAVAADSGSGISSVLDKRVYSFVNADLTISMLRPLRGEWVCLRSVTHVGPAGSAIAESQVFDQEGLVGRATQNLIVAKQQRL